MNKTNIRSLSIDNVTENDSANKLFFSCASPALYTREMDDLVYNEVLEISDSSIDFTRLVDQRSPLLFEHDMEIIKITSFLNIPRYQGFKKDVFVNF